MDILDEHLTRILDQVDIDKEYLDFPTEEVQVWSFSGGAVKWISLAQGAKVTIEEKGYPDVIVGVSAGALLAPIIAVSKYISDILDKAIELGSTLKTKDMFPYPNNHPFKRNGKPTPGAIMRVITGWNHLGWQDIAPLYRKIFTSAVFEIFKQSDIKCYAFGVKGKDFKPTIVCLNNAKTITELIRMIELSSRIIPFVQPALYKEEGYVDGGFIAMNAGWVLAPYMRVKELLSYYTNTPKITIGENSKWDNNILQITSQGMQGTVYWHSYKDRIIEELYCKLNNIKYLRFDYPCSEIDQVYDTDEQQLRAVGEESKEITKKKLEEYLSANL